MKFLPIIHFNFFLSFLNIETSETTSREKIIKDIQILYFFNIQNVRSKK